MLPLQYRITLFVLLFLTSVFLRLISVEKEMKYKEFKYYNKSSTTKISNTLQTIFVLSIVLSLKMSFWLSLVSVFVINELYFLLTFILYSLFINQRKQQQENEEK